MRLLIDTQAWLWMIGPADRLAPHARELLADAGNELYLSTASAWEIAIKQSIGKLKFPASASVHLPGAMRRSGVLPLAISMEHALRVGDLPMHHRNPFDRMLVAQAQVDELTILTADPAFARYDVAVVAA